MQDGRLLFAHYALMPNRMGYCGGGDDKALLDYCLANEADEGIEHLIRQFQAAYPYLKFIARANSIKNPLDTRVVEAYWVGNKLLDGISMADYYGFMTEQLGPRLSKKALQYLIGKLPAGAHPHHSFHVLDVSTRTGVLKESVEDMDRCRISWGEVQRVEGDFLVVRYEPLTLRDGRLSLGAPSERRAAYKVGGSGYLASPRQGDLVSMHWDWVCDRLTPSQVAALKDQTTHHIAIANQTI